MLEILTQWAQIAWNWNTCAIYLQLNEIFQGFVWFTLFDNDTMHISAPWPTIIDRAERKNGGNGHSIITTQTSEKSLKHLREKLHRPQQIRLFSRFIPWGSSLFGLTNSVTVLCKPQPLGGRYLIFPMLKTKHWATFLLAGVVPYNLLLSSYNCLVLVVPMINCSDPDCWRRRIRGSLFKAFAWVERPKNTNYFSHSVY